ncbi:GPR endopeptidase [Sporosarcina gallistercoris]|uniref:Germination protease n=1 Tax=Sporosarcina gallistercoris TaxID=2762245 RepID=A0ABR8PFD4_9BACL|nr:GPR endopeptidase [Sporosarcina gallistercoris]MBD7906876.1 GPR endopeptidase [Sporosarcina gallistercoris]
MENYDFYRTDLVVESEEMVRHRTSEEKEKLDESSGIQFNEEKKDRTILTTVVVDEEGEKRIGKKKGTYITLTDPLLHADDHVGLKKLAKTMTQQLRKLTEPLQLKEDSKLLFIGLGNKDVTPDAVGPLTMERLNAVVPDYYKEDGADVFVYSPGVTIQTGLETADFIKAVVDVVHPDLLIVIDALAARDSSRLCRTIQLTDTGIHPGSGVGNSRKEVSQESLGVPVIAIGIPTVVDGPVLIADAIDTLFGYMAAKIEEESKPSSRLSVTPWLYSDTKSADRTNLVPVFGDWASWPHEERVQLFEEVLSNHQLKTFISPKEIDSWVQHYSAALSTSLGSWIRNIKQSS